MTAEPIEWECGTCGEMVTVRHYLARGGVIVHDPEAAYREAAGLDDPDPPPPGTNECSES